MEFDRLQPIGDVRNEFNAAMIASALTNMSGKVLPDGRAVSPVDFMPLSIDRSERAQQSLIADLVGSMGAKITTRK